METDKTLPYDTGMKLTRYNMRANAEVKASNWLKIGTNTMMAYEEIAQAEDCLLYTSDAADEL